MNFLNLGIFPEFSEIIFDLNLLKTIKKRIKRGFIFARDPRGCNVARKATWQSHAGPRGANEADVTCIFIFIVIIGL